MRETQSCQVADSNPNRSRVFVNSRPISFFFLLHLIELLLGRVPASVCEAQLPLCEEMNA